MTRRVLDLITLTQVEEMFAGCTHGAFRIRTDMAYVGLCLINCVLAFVAFMLVYFFAAVGLDGELFCWLPQNI